MNPNYQQELDINPCSGSLAAQITIGGGFGFIGTGKNIIIYLAEEFVNSFCRLHHGGRNSSRDHDRASSLSD